jgi:hypothetical protein
VFFQDVSDALKFLADLDEHKALFQWLGGGLNNDLI